MFFDRRQEFRSFLCFLALAGLTGGALGGLLAAGAIAETGDARIYLSYSLGLIVACAAVSALVPLIRLHHWLLLASGALALAAAVAIATGFAPAETLAKLAFAAVTGLWISLMLPSVTQVLVIAALIIIVDIYSVFWGPTKIMVESGGPVIGYLTISLPALAAPWPQQIGISDFIFFAIFTGCALSFRLRRTATALAMTLSFVATMVISSSLETGMPALPLLSMAFLVVNADLLYRRFLEEPDEHRRRARDR